MPHGQMETVNVMPKCTIIKLGIDKLLGEQVGLLAGMRVGLICNQASVDNNFRHAADLFFEHPEIGLTTLFGPQHGIRGDLQDNMIETSHSTDSSTGLPVYSLYSETREPTAEMLENVDVLVFDLQDVGCRVYTFIYTMANAMKACAKLGKRFIVCDRPNPINGIDVEGNPLEIGHESFVGMFPIPMRHGMTVGELALMFKGEYGIDCDLEIISMDNWSRGLFYDDTDAPWVMPSPNMPSVETAVVFPATVFLEGTKVSEGRGTTRPFEIFGAPYIDSRIFTDSLNIIDLPGVYFRQVNFLPTFQKHLGSVCGGSFIHVTDRKTFRPVLTGIAIVHTLLKLYRNDFEWKAPPYEYEYDRNPFDVICGTRSIREMLESGTFLSDISASWNKGVDLFIEQRKPYLLY